MSRPQKWQYGAIHAALSKLKWDDTIKKELVYGFTKDETKLSCKDLTFEQASELITFLNAEVGKQTDSDDNACQSIRRRIIAITHQLGWYKYTNGVMALKNGNKQIDYTRLDEWLLTKSAAKKPLNDMNAKELQAAAVQINLMHLSTLKAK